MILSHQSLMNWGELYISHFSRGLVQNASIDLRLGNLIRTPKPYHLPVTKLTDPNLLWFEPVMFTEWVINPGELVLCHSIETVDISEEYAVTLECKSTTGRIGLEHLHSGFGDPGFIGQWTFEFFNAAKWPIKLVAGECYLQMVISLLDQPTSLSYKDTGKYCGQTGATAHRTER